MKYAAVFFDWGDTLSVTDANRIPQFAEWCSALIKKLYHACYRLAIISNTSRYQDSHWIRNELAKRGLLQYFEVVICSANYGVHKPDLPIFQKALDMLQVDPTKVVMVGDSAHADGGCQFLGMSYLEVQPGEDWSNRLLAKLDDPMEGRKLSNLYEYGFVGDQLQVKVRHFSDSVVVGDRIMVGDNEMQITSMSRPVTKGDALSSDHNFVTLGVQKV